MALVGWGLAAAAVPEAAGEQAAGVLPAGLEDLMVSAVPAALEVLGAAQWVVRSGGGLPDLVGAS